MSGYRRFCYTVSDIKSDLLSRDIELQINAVNVLIKNINCGDGMFQSFSVDDLIAEDTVEILCEALSTLNLDLIELIFNTMAMLAASPKFFEHHHTVYVMSSVLRSIYTMTCQKEESSAADTLCVGLELLSVIINRLSKLSVDLSSVCDPVQLLQVLRKLVEEGSDKRTVLNSADLFSEVMASLGAPPGSQRNLLEAVIADYLGALRRHSDDTCSVAIMADIVHKATRLLSDFGTVEEPGEEQLVTQLKEILFSVLIPCIASVDVSGTDTEVMLVLLKSLLGFYGSDDAPTVNLMTSRLVKMDFINFLNSLETTSQDPETVQVVRGLLFELLACLCTNVLGDSANWGLFLERGFSNLPERISEWNLGLCQGKGPPACGTIILVHYFSFLFGNSIEDLLFPKTGDTLLLELSSYLRTIAEPLPEPLLKAFWFIFCVAHLSTEEKPAIVNGATKTLLSWLCYSKIQNVYTHHPAELYWVFSCPGIPRNLQKSVLSQWVGHDDEEVTLKELKNVTLVNRRACSALLDVLSSCDAKAADRIVALLESILSEDKSPFGPQIIEEAWSSLPIILSSSFDAEKMKNVISFLTLCCRSVPKRLEPTIVLRLSCLVPGALVKYHHAVSVPLGFTQNERSANVFAQGFKLVIILMVVSSANNDKRGIVAVLHHEHFLKLAEGCISTEDTVLRLYTVQLFATLLKFQAKYDIKSVVSIELTSGRLLGMVCGDDGSMVEAGLQLLATCLESAHRITPLVKITIPTTAQLRTLYTHLQMICAKFTGETAACCWKCLHQLLKFSYEVELEGHLAAMPLTRRLLEAFTPEDPAAWEEMMGFVATWLVALCGLQTNRQGARKYCLVPGAKDTIGRLVERALDNPSRAPLVQSAIVQIAHYEAVPYSLKPALKQALKTYSIEQRQ